MRRLLGIGYRRELDLWIATRPPEVECLEITAEHFFDARTEEKLMELAHDYPFMVHGLGLSLGTPGPLDRQTFDAFCRVVRIANPLWVSEHLAFTRTHEVDLGHLNPIRPTRESIRIVSDHAQEVMERTGKPLLLENITSHLRLSGELSETEFLNRVCEESGCSMLLDIANLYINSRNHGFEARRWLREIEPSKIRQLHVVGYSESEGRLEDYHAEKMQSEVLDLLRETIDYSNPEAIILERDINLETPTALLRELKEMECLLG